MEQIDDWDDYFLGMASYVSRKSKDPSTKVGSIIVRPDRTVASVGFNGFPRGLDDDPALYADREKKYARTIHAEVNAVLNAKESLKGTSAYVTAPPCVGCALVLIQSGVAEVVHPVPSHDLMIRWGDSINQARKLFEEAGVEVIEV